MLGAAFWANNLGGASLRPTVRKKHFAKDESLSGERFFGALYTQSAAAAASGAKKIIIAQAKFCGAIRQKNVFVSSVCAKKQFQLPSSKHLPYMLQYMVHTSKEHKWNRSSLS